MINLERARDLFADKHGLYSKIALLTERLKFPDTPIRVGLLGAKGSLLNSILADPFASNQSWYEQFQLRSHEDDVVVKFSHSFEQSGNVYNVPSPFLSERNLEFVELKHLSPAEDGCHCYITFQNGVPLDTQNWPVYQYVDIPNNDLGNPPPLAQKEVCSEISQSAVDLLIESPQNATIYTKLYGESHISQFIKLISAISEPYTVISKLYNSVRKNMDEQNAVHSMTVDELSQRDGKIRKFISQWDEESHHELQTSFKAHVNEYEARQLPWWKLYYRADDIQAIFAEMLKDGILTDSLKNYSYVKGQIDSFTSFQLEEKPHFRSKLEALDHNELTTLKRNVIQTDLLQLQNKAVKIIMTNVLTLQLPFVLLAIPGSIVYDFSTYSMVGLASLGIFMGFNRISREWLREVESFKQDLFEKTRLAILDVNRSLYEDWAFKYEEEKTLIYKRQQAIEALEEDLGL